MLAPFRTANGGAAQLVPILFGTLLFLAAAAVLVLAGQEARSTLDDPVEGPVQADAEAVLDALLRPGSTGDPMVADWIDGSGSIDSLAWLGLAEAGERRLDPDKILNLQRGLQTDNTGGAAGDVDYDEAVDALPLDGRSFHVRTLPLLPTLADLQSDPALALPETVRYVGLATSVLFVCTDDPFADAEYAWLQQLVTPAIDRQRPGCPLTSPAPYSGLGAYDVLVVGSGVALPDPVQQTAITTWLDAGGTLIILDATQAWYDALLAAPGDTALGPLFVQDPMHPARRTPDPLSLEQYPAANAITPTGAWAALPHDAPRLLVGAGMYGDGLAILIPVAPVDVELAVEEDEVLRLLWNSLWQHRRALFLDYGHIAPTTAVTQEGLAAIIDPVDSTARPLRIAVHVWG